MVARPTPEGFKARFKRDPIPKLGEPCAHGGSPIDCEACCELFIASLPALAPSRCREHTVDAMRVVKFHCSHAVSAARTGRALVCDQCGWAAHQWWGYVCGRKRPKHGKIEAENRLCPIQARLLEQKRQAVPA